MIIAILIIITVYSIIYIFFDIFSIIFVLFSLRSRQYYLRFSLYNFFSLISYLVFALIISFCLHTPFFIIPISPSAYTIYISMYCIYLFFNHISIFFISFSPFLPHRISPWIPLLPIYTRANVGTSSQTDKPTILPVRSHNRIETHLFSLSHFRFPASASSVSTRGNRGYF